MYTPEDYNFVSYFSDGGESGELIRQNNWESSSLGFPGQWPAALRVSVSNLLRTSLPMFVLWGKDHICFYNDAVTVVLDPKKQPGIGRPARQIWAEGWNLIGPLLDGMLANGKPVSFQNSTVRLFQNGRPEKTGWSFCCSVILDELAAPAGVLICCLQITPQLSIEPALPENQTFLQSIIDLAELGSYSIDVPTNRITKSPRVAEWYGLPESTDVTSSLGAVLESDRQRIGQVLAGALANGSDGFYQVEYTVLNAISGLKRILRTNGQVVWDPSGQPLRINGAVQDITLQRELQLALEQQVELRTQELATINEELEAQNEEYVAVNEELEEANQLLIRSNESLQQFSYIVSHDLQEPLRKIRQFSEILKKQYGRQLGSGTEYLDRMQSAGSRMSALIDDLLAFAHISVHKKKDEQVALEQVIKDILLDQDLLIEETGATINVGPLPVVAGDGSQLRQLFQNLLSNALKFRHAATAPLVQVRSALVAGSLLAGVSRDSPASRYHCIEVADNGLGFDEKYLDRIFQVFQRLHGRAQFAGTGIGLSICEKVVTNHGGMITARSKPGEGATFVVYLPVSES